MPPHRSRRHPALQRRPHRVHPLLRRPQQGARRPARQAAPPAHARRGRHRRRPLHPHPAPQLRRTPPGPDRHPPEEALQAPPRFPQGGLIDAREYDEGRGKVRLRAVIDQKDEATLVIRELPYGVTTETLIASIEDAIKKGKIKTKAIRDYTAGKVEIEIALAADADIQQAIQALYVFTQCEVSLSLRPIVIREQRPVELSVHDILRHNTKRLVDLLRKELQIERKKIDEALQSASLVRLFIVHRIYKRIEECKTAPEVKQAILDGLAPFRDQLRRDIVQADLDMLLAIPIRRISLYDINKSRKEEDDLLADFDAVEKNLTDVTGFAIKYLKNLYRDYADLHPAAPAIAKFDTIEMRELTAKEHALSTTRKRAISATTSSAANPSSIAPPTTRSSSSGTTAATASSRPRKNCSSTRTSSTPPSTTATAS
jgi:topoisomerase IV subunit A